MMWGGWITETPGGLIGYSRQGAELTMKLGNHRQSDKPIFFLFHQSQAAYFVRTVSPCCRCGFISYFQRYSNWMSDAVTAEKMSICLLSSQEARCVYFSHPSFIPIS